MIVVHTEILEVPLKDLSRVTALVLHSALTHMSGCTDCAFGDLKWGCGKVSKVNLRFGKHLLYCKMKERMLFNVGSWCHHHAHVQAER